MAADDQGADEHFKLAVGLATEGLKSLLIVNGGAAVALIAILKAYGDSSAYAARALLPSISAFGAGAVFTTVAFVFGYFSQLSYANQRFHHAQRDAPLAAKCQKRHCLFQVLTIFAVAATLLCSGWGIYEAWTAFTTN